MPRRIRPNHKQKPFGFPAEVEALLETGDGSAADALSAMAETGSPEIAKAARRALHRLELRGVRPSRQSSSAETRDRGIGARGHGLHAARMAQSDLAGDRTFAMARSDSAGHVTEFLINASGTVAKVSQLPFGLDAYASDLPRVLDEPLMCATIPADFARYRIHEAARRTHETNALRPVGMSAALSSIGPCERAYERSLIYEHMDAGTNINIVEDEVALQREAITIVTTFDREGIIEFVEAAVKVLKSRVVLTDRQRKEEFNRVARPLIDRMMPGPVYEEALRRLEDHALLYYLDGDHSKARTILLRAVQGRRADGPGAWSLAQFAAELALYRYLRAASDEAGADLPDDDDEDEASGPIIHLPR